jgi:NTP pyrophosphatase (non-canonical NTP hydrolase)
MYRNGNTFDSYNDAVKGFAQYPMQGSNMIYPAMGLVGEAGELCDKIKKHWRNYVAYKQSDEIDGMAGKSVSDKERQEIIKEMGDVLWYLNALALELNTTLSHVAVENYLKLKDRAIRNVIKSEGDNR